MTPTPSRAAGLTLVELTIGMAATALVTAAMAGFAAGVADGWRATDAARSVHVAADAADARLRALANPAKYVANCSGPDADPTQLAWAVLWRADDFAGTAGGKSIASRDGVAQMGELSVMEYQPANASLWVLESLPYDRLDATARAQAAQPVSRETLEGSNVYDLFKYVQSRGQAKFLAPPRLLVGPGALRAGDLTQARLTAATFLPPDQATWASSTPSSTGSGCMTGPARRRA